MTVSAGRHLGCNEATILNITGKHAYAIHTSDQVRTVHRLTRPIPVIECASPSFNETLKMHCISQPTTIHFRPVQCPGSSMRGVNWPRRLDQLQPSAMNGGRVLLTGAVTVGLLLGQEIFNPPEAFAARTGGRAGSSAFKSRRAAA